MLSLQVKLDGCTRKRVFDSVIISLLDDYLRDECVRQRTVILAMILVILNKTPIILV